MGQCYSAPETNLYKQLKHLLKSSPSVNYECLLECSLLDVKLGEMINSGIKCTLSRFANGTKLCSMVDMLVGRDVIQRDNLER